MKFKIFSLGCKVNSYECSAISSLLINEGFYEAKDDTPDIFIINTCSVTATADQKSRQHIRKFMNMYPNAISIVMGCYSQGNYKFIFDEIKPCIVIGTSYRNQIPKLINDFLKNHQRILLIDENIRNFKYEDFGITSYTENTRAYLKIQDGCDNFCSYCVVPFRRGKMRSRDFLSIINEAKHLIIEGYKEIVLTGIHVGGYGKDLNNIKFSDLVESLLNLAGLNSLRISSIEESEIDEKLINLMETKSNFAKHFHIPLQSGSESVLKRMNRKYNPTEFKNKISLIKSKVRDVMISSDVIVGFPGESEEEFLETYNLIKECEINQLHVFSYSIRPGTLASKMPNQIDPQVKNIRSKSLLDLSSQMWDKYIEQYLNKNVDILIEEFDGSYNVGHTSNFIKVKIPGNKEKIGEIVSVLLQKDMIISK